MLFLARNLHVIACKCLIINILHYFSVYATFGTILAVVEAYAPKGGVSKVTN